MGVLVVCSVLIRVPVTTSSLVSSKSHESSATPGQGCDGEFSQYQRCPPRGDVWVVRSREPSAVLGRKGPSDHWVVPKEVHYVDRNAWYFRQGENIVTRR